MKILLVWPNFFPNATAAVVRGYAFAKYLQKLGNHIEVISPIIKNEIHESFLKLNKNLNPIKIHRLPIFLNPRDFIKIPYSLPKLKDTIKKFNPDIIIASSTPSTITWETAKISKNLNIKYIMDIRDPYAASLKAEKTKPIRHKFAEYFERYSIKNSYLIFTVSHRLKELIKNFYNVNPEKIKIVPNGFIGEDIKKSKKIEFETDIILSGSVGEPGDNQENIILAISEIIKSCPNTKISFLGCKDEEFINYIKKLNSENIEILPQVSHEEVYSYLLQSKIGLTSLSTHNVFKCAIGAKIYEYLGSGLPIVASGPKEGELKNFIESNNIGLYSSDKISFSKNIITLLEDNNLRQNFHLNALKTAKLYDREKIIYDAYKNYIHPLENKI